MDQSFKTNDMNTSGSSKATVRCSFCNEETKSSEIGQHLMTCGNKTDQCPNCQKYIRRAIFAYHYENKCANLDELDASENTSTQQTNNPATRQPEIQPPFLSPADVNTLDEKRRVIIPVDLSRFPEQSTTATGQTGSDFCEPKKTIVSCQYCSCQCDFSEREIHETNCLRNPENIKKKPSSQMSSTREQNPNQSNRLGETANNETIPCEICREPIEWRDFDAHMKACAKCEEERAQRQRLSVVENNDGCLRCRYCDALRIPKSMEFHEKLCRNTNGGINDPNYRGCYHLPPLSGNSPQPNA